MRFYLLFLLFLNAPSLASEDIPEAIQQAEKAVWEINSNQILATGFFIGKKYLATSFNILFEYLADNNYSLHNLQLSQKGLFSDIKFKRIHDLSFTHGLIIFETDKEVSHYLKLPSETPELTNSVFAIGYPDGLFKILKNVNSNFLIDEHMINGQFNSNYENYLSGAPVLNDKGELIGMTHAGIFNLLEIIRINYLKKLIESPKDKNISIQSLIKKQILKSNDVFTKYIMATTINHKYVSAKYDLDSFQLFKKSAEEGHASSQFDLGMMLHFGDGPKKDLKESIYWLEQAAKQNLSSAQFNLGIMYYDGIGTKKNFKEAIYWYRKAAEQGFAPAQYELGLMYLNGTGIEKNLKEAIYWIKKAAEQDYDWAQYKLGMLFYYGKIINKDPKKARYWLERAAKQNNILAKIRLKYIKISNKCQAIFK